MEVVLAVEIGRWRPLLGRSSKMRTATDNTRSGEASGPRLSRRWRQRLDRGFDRGRLWRLIIVKLQFELPLILTGGLELERSLLIGRIDTVDRKCPALGVDQIQPLNRTRG